jgi:TatD DNase family protein
MVLLMEKRIIYRYHSRIDTIYMNIIGRFACLNSCIFCGKPTNKDSDLSYPEEVYGKGLYLPESPNIETIFANLDKEVKPTDKVLAFVGLGEPLLYFPKVLKIIRRAKKKYSLITKVDTCGLVEPFFPDVIERLEEAGLDSIFISLNAVNSEDYSAICHPKVDNAFNHLLKFIKKANSSKIKTNVSFILDYEKDDIKTKSKEDYLKFALSLGLKEEQIIWREYMPI